jgi:hypothetical protein
MKVLYKFKIKLASSSIPIVSNKGQHVEHMTMLDEACSYIIIATEESVEGQVGARVVIYSLNRYFLERVGRCTNNSNKFTGIGVIMYNETRTYIEYLLSGIKYGLVHHFKNRVGL